MQESCTRLSRACQAIPTNRFRRAIRLKVHVKRKYVVKNVSMLFFRALLTIKKKTQPSFSINLKKIRFFDNLRKSISLLSMMMMMMCLSTTHAKSN